MSSRRAVLRSVGVGLVAGVADCATDDQSTPTETTTEPPGSWGHVQPEVSAPIVPEPLACDGNDLRRLTPNADVNWGIADWDGTDDALALRIEDTEYALGDTVEIRLYNRTETERETRTDEEFLVQVRTKAGWQTVFGYSDDSPYPFTDDIAIHEPGLSDTWRIPLTDNGVMDGYAHEQATVCPALQPGRYRFVFPIDAPALAVAFDVTV